MEFNGKLITDADQIKEPQGSWVNAWNVILDKSFTSLKNEDGFELKVSTDFVIIGRCSTPVGIVICSVNLAQTVSRIEIFDPVANTLTLILQSNTTIPLQDCGLNFKLENPIEIVYKFNFRKQLIVAFWEGIKADSNKPRMINLNSLPFDVDVSKLITAAEKALGKSDLISLFPDVKVPIFNFEVSNGGGLIDAGAIYFTIAYFIDETDVTNWVNFEVPVIITNYNYDTDSTLSDNIDKVNKSIKINFTQLDEKFKYFKLGIVNKTATGSFPKVVGKYEIPTGGNKKVIFNGSFNDELISLDNIIVPTDSYEKVKTGTNFNGQLILGNVVSKSVLNYQPFANNINMEWRWGGATQIHRDLPGQDADTTKNAAFLNNVHAQKTFMPDEVYAFYIHWILTSGQVTEGYHIPGRVFAGNERDLVSTFGSAEELLLNPEARRFHTRDTNNYAGTTIGTFGYWENADEVYPNTNDFLVKDVNAGTGAESTIGDIRGQRVRHHKFPSNVYASTNPILQLGIVAGNVKIPASMLSRVQGYVISYAIREGENKTILGTSMLFNYGNDEGGPGVAPALIPLNKSVKFYDPKLLTDKERINPSYLKTVLNSAAILNPAVSPTYEGRYGDIGATAPTLAFYKVNDYNYIPDDNGAAVPTNRWREAYLQLKTYSDIPLTEMIEQEKAVPFNTTHMFNLCSLPLNIYQNFYDQEVAFTNFIFKTVAGQYNYSGNTNTIFNGDCYANNAKVRTYIPHNDDLGATLFDYISATVNDPVGTLGKTLTTYWIQRSQLLFSYRKDKKQDIGIYPLKGIVLIADDGETFDNKVADPNSIYNHYEYNRVYSSINNLKKVGCYNPFITFIEELPYRIPVSNKYQSEAQTNNWRKFTSYFEMPNNKGEVWVLNSSDRVIYIQMKYGLFITAIKDQLENSDSTAVLGITSIFDRPPEEIVIENAGYIGCQSQWAAFVCKHGYIVADKQRGKIFVYSEGANEITRVDNFNFFKKNLEASASFIDSDNPFLGKGLSMSFNDEDNILVITKNYLLDTSTKSFTISYNFDRKGFISRHSYIPNALLYDRKNMYSINTVGGVSTIYKHNHKLNKGIYYIVGTPYSSYVDVIFNLENDVNKSFGSFNWKTDVKNLIDKATQFSKTATHVIVYNEVQCSGLIVLTTNQSSFTGNNSRQIRGTWHFNSFRDAVSNSAVAFFDDDLNVITGNFNFNKNWFDKSKFFGKFIALRLIYDNIDQKEFTVNSIDVTQKLNNRN